MSDHRGIPIVRLTLESMQHSILMAFTEQAASIAEEVQSAVKAMCTPERIAAIIKEQAEDGIKRAIESEVRDFYAFGAGRETIKRAVISELTERQKSARARK